MNLTVVSGPPDLRVRRRSGEVIEYCFLLPPGFSGTIELRIRDGAAVTKEWLVVAP